MVRKRGKKGEKIMGKSRTLRYQLGRLYRIDGKYWTAVQSKSTAKGTKVKLVAGKKVMWRMA